MHILFVHKEYPGHFGHIAHHLARNDAIQCTLVYSGQPLRYQSATPAARAAPMGAAPITISPRGVSGAELPDDATADGVRLIRYASRGASRETHPLSLHFEISTWHNDAVLRTLRARPEIRPDLVVGHASYATALHLADHYGCPLVNYCEFFHNRDRSHLLFRPDYPPKEADLLARHAFNAANLLSLEASTVCYSPTRWQRSLFPTVYQPKIETIFDGIDRQFWRRRPVARQILGRPVPEGTRIVTYCAYGLEPTRGFDIFMSVAQRICQARSDVIFVVVGADRAYYGPQPAASGLKTFREHVLAHDRYDLDRFIFTGQVLEESLVEILSLSDLHVYLTVPFVLSWSLMDALACGCVVVGSDTAPVREMIEHGKNGLLADFFDVEGLAREALRVLADPAAHRPLADAGERMIDEAYRLEQTLPRTLELYQRAANAPRAGERSSATR